ncbi:MAG: thiamine pyrophosphate-dependent enzyme, partial [Methanoregulaceae archaeon]|nr:thiamine pyrophosphate-dependent enzyme [Methanoregulaceae archaeon]
EVRECGRPFVREHRLLDPPSGMPAPERFQDRGFCRTFCRNCPFLPLVRKLSEKEIAVIADAGCSVLAMNPPFRIGVASYGLGSAIAVAARSTGVALMGDYAVLHSGIPALIDVFEKGTDTLVLVLKNTRMGMTGGQPVPDIIPYIAWAKPVVCGTNDEEKLETALFRTGCPRVVVIEGECPEGRTHEIVECRDL